MFSSFALSITENRLCLPVFMPLLLVKRPGSGHANSEAVLRIKELKQPEVRLLLSPGKPSFPQLKSSAEVGSY